MKRYQSEFGPPACPESLPSEWRGVWESVVSSVGPDHWRASDAPVVEAFVTSLARLRAVQAIIAADGEIGADGERTQASRIADACAKALVQAAPKLRLCPSARHDARQAARSTSGSRASDNYLSMLDGLRESADRRSRNK